VGGGSAAVTVTHFQQRGFVLKTKKGAHRSSKTAEAEKTRRRGRLRTKVLNFSF
jgi:hypothetical protein